MVEQWQARLLAEADFEKKQLVIATLLTLVGTGFVLGRLYIRGRCLLKHWFIDDWFILLSMILGIASYLSWDFANIPELLVHQRNGSTLPTSSEDAMERELAELQANSYNLIGLASNCAFIALQATAGRLSIFYTFRRLSSSPKTRIIRIIIHVFSVVMVLATIALVWLSLSPCWPPRDIRLENGKGCLAIGEVFSPNYRPLKLWLFLFSSIFNAITDLFAFTLPFLIFRGANVTKQQRHGLYCLFGFGFVVFIISVARAAISGEILRKNDMDGSLMTTTPLILGVTEANGVMVGAALPVLAKPLFRSIRDTATALIQRRSNGGSRNTGIFQRDLEAGELDAGIHYRSESKDTLASLEISPELSLEFSLNFDPPQPSPSLGFLDFGLGKLEKEAVPPVPEPKAPTLRVFPKVSQASPEEILQQTTAFNNSLPKVPQSVLQQHEFGSDDFMNDCETALKMVGTRQDFYHAM